MKDYGLREKLAQSLKDWLKEYEVVEKELDFEIIHTLCKLINVVDPKVAAKHKKKELCDTIIVNPRGRLGNLLFFVDPEEL
jgi:hypothetical protein